MDAQEFREEFDEDYSVAEPVRDLANEEFRFTTVPGGQWENYLEDAYEDRAKMEVDQIDDYINRTYADWCDNRMGLKFSPDDETTTSEEAELQQGLYRRDLRNKGGQDSIDTAVFEAMRCGMGAYMFATEYEDDEDEANDYQNICIKEITNAYSCVFFDSSARLANKSDASRVSVLVPYTKKGFDKEFPGADPGITRSLSRNSRFNWGSAQTVFVCARYHTKTKSVKVGLFHNPVTDEVHYQDIDDDYELIMQELSRFGFVFVNDKKVKRRQVFKDLYSGDQKLKDTKRIYGKHLPVIPLYAFRSMVDGVEHFHGLARKRMDAQRMLNMSVSLAAESAAHSHEGKPIFAPEQMTGLSSLWAKNQHNQPYALARPLYDESGNVLHAGPTGMLPGSTLAPAAAALIEMNNQFLQSGTGGAPQDIADPDASGKAINALIKRVDKNVRPVFNNIRSSLIWGGQVWQSMAAEVYSTHAGRVVRTVNQREETTPVVLLKSAPNGAGTRSLNDPSKGKFKAVIDITRDYQTQQEEAFEGLKDYLSIIPPDKPLFDQVSEELAIRMPFPDLDAMKKQVRRQQLMKGAEPESDEEMQFMQAMTQQQGEKGEDPNTLYLKAAAAEQQTQAAMNAAKIQETQADIAYKASQARKLDAETQKILKELTTTSVAEPAPSAGEQPGIAQP